MNVATVRHELLQAYQRRSPSAPTIELIGTSFLADEDAILRPPNDDYIKRELAWYRSQSRSVSDIPGAIPKIWAYVADRDGIVNSNYGHLVFSQDNGSQYHHVLRELQRNPCSRRGVMIYTRPTMHRDAYERGREDFVCTHAVNYFIRESLLHAVVQMRSNDAVFGYPNDLAWQRFLHRKLSRDLDVGPGAITWQAASFHVYQRHYHLLEKL